MTESSILCNTTLFKKSSCLLPSSFSVTPRRGAPAVCRRRERSGSAPGAGLGHGTSREALGGSSVAGGFPGLQPVASAVLAAAAPPSEERSSPPAGLALPRLSSAGNHNAVSAGQGRSSVSSPSFPVPLPPSQARGPAEASSPPALQQGDKDHLKHMALLADFPKEQGWNREALSRK